MPETGSVIGMASAYASLPQSATGALPDLTCPAGAEVGAASALADVSGTYGGTCRDTAAATIGPAARAASCM